MLSVAFELLPALKTMWTTCPDLIPFKVNDVYLDTLATVHKVLKQFENISTLLESEKDVTLPLVVVSMNLLLDLLEKKIKSLDKKPGRTKDDEQLLLAFQAGRETS